MRKAQEILVLVAAIVGLLGEARCGAAESDTEALISRLNSEDFEIREKATVELEAHDPKIWNALAQLAKNTPFETRGRAERIMRTLSHRALIATRESIKKKMADGEANQELLRLKMAHVEKQSLDAYRVNFAARDELKNTKSPSTEAQARAVAAEVSEQSALKLYRETRAEFNQHEVAWPREKSKMQDRIRLCDDLIKSGALVSPADVEMMNPAALPFQMRLTQKLSFDWTNIPLSEVLAQFSSLSGISIEVAEEAKSALSNNVTLRVEDMETELVAKWICHCASVERSVDSEKQKIVICTVKDDKNSEIEQELQLKLRLRSR